MAFYYLHEVGSPVPKKESGFKYLVYFEGKAPNRFRLPDDEGVDYCPHEISHKPSWNFDDEYIDVVTSRESMLVTRFKKTIDQVGFTVWKNTGEF